MKKKITHRVAIVDWIDSVLVSVEKAQYYTAKHKLPKKYKPILKRFGARLLYVDSKNKAIVKNTKTIGKRNIWKVNGQDFYSLKLHWSTRSKIKTFYHGYFSREIRSQLPKRIILDDGNRFKIRMVIHTLRETGIPDITNTWILLKIFEDTLVQLKIIPDDDPKHVNDIQLSYKISKKRKLEFIITQKKR